MAPLSIAAYVTWLAIAFEPLASLLRGQLAATPQTLAGASGLIATLALFMRCSHGDVAGRGTPRLRALVLAQVATALLAIWGLPRYGSMPVLLIIVAAQIFSVFGKRSAWALLVAINLVLGVLLALRYGFAAALSPLLAYCGFEAFASLTTSYALRAEQARETVSRINAELLATRRLLLESARGEERLRLSRELHDVAGHKLTALKLQLRVLEREIPEATQRAAVADCVRLSDELLADVRGVVDTLRAHDGIDLHAALTALVPLLPRPRVSLTLADDARVSRLDQAQALLRCAQEGLTNALRHSGAEQVHLRLAVMGQGVELQVEDDGRATAAPVPGNGLRGMHERLAAVGGQLVIETIAGGGLRLRARIPAEAASA